MQKAIILVFFIALISCLSTSAQGEIKNGLLADDGPNVAYSNFTKGYADLNARTISNAYTENAILINVYNSAEPQSYYGRNNIYAFFEKTLDQARQQNLGLKIIFKITDRQVIDDSILDNGYYKLEISSPDQEKRERFGKFSIVLFQELNEWKFNMDTNASATQEEYLAAQSIQGKSN